jgi:hypothetical protein
MIVAGMYTMTDQSKDDIHLLDVAGEGCYLETISVVKAITSLASVVGLVCMCPKDLKL